ncbi:MAG: DUF4434 domain-containing protein [Eubacteriales bacterium]|nr:DUF4434 domain-containing protein [Eubacteriales bacterium]MDD4474222.1 DUF4434 domain-containing protein [Eubacteriales bacterium]
MFLKNKLMKTLTSLLLAVTALLGFVSCSKDIDKIIDSSSYLESDSDNNNVQTPEGDYPFVTGTFIQPFALANLSKERTTTHLQTLFEVGIDTVILQWSAVTPYGSFQEAYYPSKNAKVSHTENFNENSTELIENLLSAAEELGIKVFIGLNNADEWWSFGPSDAEWNEKQAQTGIIIAQEIYDLYKSKYPAALHGWYYVWEMSNGSIIKWPKENGKLLNLYLDNLAEIDSTMPIMLSPFICEVDGSAELTGNKLKEMLEIANFREGDIYCCQDSVGAGFMSLQKLDEYFSSIKDAVKTKPGLEFWANCENFVHGEKFASAPIDRFISQMKIASEYVTGLVTFSYSHYYSPDLGSSEVYHEVYKQYYKTGTIPASDKPGTPIIVTNKIDGRDAVSVSLEIMQSTYGVSSVNLYINDELINTLTNKSIKSNKTMKSSIYVDLSKYEEGETVVITAIAYDLNNNCSLTGTSEYKK